MSSALCESIAITGLASYFPTNSKTFKQMQSEMTLEIPPEKPDMEQILHDTINVKISDTFVIETPRSKSYEGQVLTGHKLIINGEILQKVEYVADNCTQSVHVAEFSTKFSTYIILDHRTAHPLTYKVTPYIEDIYIKQLGRRHIFQNATILLDAVPMNTELLGSPCFEPAPCFEKEIPLGKQFDCGFIPRHTSLFTQFSCVETMVLSPQKPDIEQITSVIVDPEIISVKFINTIKGASVEGQLLTGKKAIIEIKLKQKVLYAADCADQSIYGAESICFKSTYIVLPPLIEGTDPELLYKSNRLKVNLTIEDLYAAKQGKKKIFKSICMLAEIQLIPTYEICYSTYHNCTKSELFLCFEDGSSSTQITKSKHYKSIKPAWSPNGAQIAYLSGTQEGYTLSSFNLKNNSQQTLIPHDAFENISSFSWLKDSQQIIFSALRNESKELYLFNMVNNICRQITEGAGLIKSYYPKVSPDGCLVAYLRTFTNYAEIWVSDVFGNDARRITETSAVKDFDWLADSKRLVYFDNTKENSCELYLKSPNDLHSTCIASCDFLYGCNALSVSPDDRYIAFVGTNRCSDDIYVYDMHKKKLYNITNHESSIKITSIAWKIDSSKIYYAAKEFMYFDICSVDIDCKHKERLTNTDSSSMQLAYRPKIK